MEKEKKEARIQVAKAVLPLGPNQTLKDFTRELREELKPPLGKALKLKWESGENQSAYMYVVDIFGDHIVAEVHQWQKGKGGADTYWLVPYARGAGGFAFGAPVEVVKEVHYVPKVSVSKRVVPEGQLWADIL